jgi:hypothetical protein
MRISDENGQEQFRSRGKQYYSGGKRRREMSMMGNESIHIERPDLGVSWTLIPAMHSYTEHRDGATSDARGDDMPDPLSGDEGVEFQRIGSETVNGVKAEKYSVRMKDGTGTAWMTSDNIPVRFQGTVDAGGLRMQLRMDWENVQIGPQRASLFELPEGYRGGLSPVMPGLPTLMGLGGGMPGADGRAPTEAEVEAYKAQMQRQLEQLRKQMEATQPNR